MTRQADQAKRGPAETLLLLALMCLLLLVLTQSCYGQAGPIHVPAFTAKNCIRAAIGEAANQGYKGLLAVCCAIRNRKTLRGVYGFKASFVDHEPVWVWKLAERAWEESGSVDITGGADHWHNVTREGENYWTRAMTRTVCIKDHCFYR